MEIIRQLKQLLQECREELLLTPEVRRERSNKKFQEEYGLSDEEMSTFRDTWEQIKIRRIQRMAIAHAVAFAGTLTIIGLILKVLE